MHHLQKFVSFVVGNLEQLTIKIYYKLFVQWASLMRHRHGLVVTVITRFENELLQIFTHLYFFLLPRLVKNGFNLIKN